MILSVMVNPPLRLMLAEAIEALSIISVQVMRMLLLSGIESLRRCGGSRSGFVAFTEFSFPGVPPSVALLMAQLLFSLQGFSVSIISSDQPFSQAE